MFIDHLENVWIARVSTPYFDGWDLFCPWFKLPIEGLEKESVGVTVGVLPDIVINVINLSE